jgi:3-oxoacyl-[acyl-carrier protein] reductase
MSVFPSGTVALVTGAGRGIGRAVAEDLARAGAGVVVTYNQSESAAKDTVAAIEEAGGTAWLRQLDVTEEQSVRQTFREVRRELRRLDILVCNAGINLDGFLVAMSTKKFETVVEVNLHGTVYCCREAAKIMMNQRSGSIVTISSAPGVRGFQGATNYCASKGAIVSFTRSLSQEVASHGIRVNAVAPGFINTEMVSTLPAEIRERYLELVPLGRLGTAEEIAPVVTFLASDRASYITGSVITADGGLIL